MLSHFCVLSGSFPLENGSDFLYFNEIFLQNIVAHFLKMVYYSCTRFNKDVHLKGDDYHWARNDQHGTASIIAAT